MSIISTMSPEKRSEFRAWGKEEVAELEDRVHSKRVGLASTVSEYSMEDEDQASEESDKWTVVDECWSETEVETPYEVIILKE